MTLIEYKKQVPCEYRLRLIK